MKLVRHQVSHMNDSKSRGDADIDPLKDDDINERVKRVMGTVALRMWHNSYN
jgi:hypothetical protein